MAGITDRNRQKNELAGIGYSLRYIDEWQPKARLYRHKAAYNVEGVMMEDVGTYVDNVPGNPDYVLRKAKIGLFPWLPSAECSCKWCGERQVATPTSPKPARNTVMGPYFKAES
jgi:hypothetical protein